MRMEVCIRTSIFRRLRPFPETLTYGLNIFLISTVNSLRSYRLSYKFRVMTKCCENDNCKDINSHSLMLITRRLVTFRNSSSISYPFVGTIANDYVRSVLRVPFTSTHWTMSRMDYCFLIYYKFQHVISEICLNTLDNQSLRPEFTVVKFTSYATWSRRLFDASFCCIS